MQLRKHRFFNPFLSTNFIWGAGEEIINNSKKEWKGYQTNEAVKNARI